MNNRITLTCPGCSAKLAVDSQHAGKKLKCPKCLSLVPVPDNDDDSSSVAQTPTSMPPAVPDSAPDAPAKSSETFKFVLIVALVVFGPAIGFLIWDRVARQAKVAEHQKERERIDGIWDRVHRDRELERRKSWRELHHKFVMEAIGSGDFADLDRLKEELKEKEKEWKEEDFRKELLEATRNR